MTQSNFSKKILQWYDDNKRDLPWRHTRDPYKIWLSEIILQQTRIVQGLPYYLRFIEKYPTVIKLADAKEDDVLRLWQGLGYYSRARNLHSCAKKIKTDFKGSFPNNFNDLRKLAGIGDYTAAAIASIAFREPIAVADGNVFRVLSRVYGLDHDISTSVGKKYFFKKANELIDKDYPDLFNQAVMEFGALHCTPQNPNCESCILKKSCIAFVHNQQSLFPVNSKKQKVKKRYFTYWVIEHQGKLLMRKREKDIWKGLYDFYLTESTRPVKPESQKINYKIISNSKFQVSNTYKHVLSHQLLMARFVQIKISKENGIKELVNENGLAFYTKKQIQALPKPKLISRYLHDYGYLEEH
jgi:A/G-specific adenine glycosylase